MYDKGKKMTHSLWSKPGTFYSPIPSDKDIQRALQTDPKNVRSIPGIIISDEEMCRVWDQIGPYSENMPFSENKEAGEYRYYYGNNMHGRGDASIYYGMINHLKPKRIIEIGSGFSSALAMDARRISDLDIDMTFIDPNPVRLHNMIMDDEHENTRIIESEVQDVPLDLFRSLESNDILFIDSSHVAKTGSDVLFEVFEILSALSPGVVIQIHDCFWPFEYIPRWLGVDNRAWNELYFIRAFLMYNREFDVMFFNHYFRLHHFGEVEKYPRSPFNSIAGGSLWLRRAHLEHVNWSKKN